MWAYVWNSLRAAGLNYTASQPRRPRSTLFNIHRDHYIVKEGKIAYDQRQYMDTHSIVQTFYLTVNTVLEVDQQALT
jgi:hypothetical protein